MTNDREPFSGVPLLNIEPDTLSVPKQRLKSPATLRNIFQQARRDDEINAANRADVQGLLDGDPPFDQAELDAAGCGGNTNLNWRGAETQYDRAVNPYYRLIQSQDELVTTPTAYGLDEEKAGWQQILSEEITRAFRTSEWFVFQTSKLMHQFIYHGLGIGFFRDRLDWRYRGGGMGQFYFPRQSFTDESEHEIITSTDEMNVAGRGSLYDKIKNAPDGENDYHGWNVRAVKMAISKATSSHPLYNDWERLTDEFKNNDLSIQNSTQKVRVIHGFVQEFDGTVSHYITTEESCTDTENEEKFLYICRGKFRNVREILVMFPYGIGSNTKTHSVRGLGHKIFPFEQQFNRSMSRMVDASNRASSLMLQAVDENSYNEVAYQTIGDCSIISAEAKIIEHAPPDLQRSVMPVLQEMRQMRGERTAGYSADNVFDGDQRKTKYEISAGLEQNAALSDVEQEFFYLPFERLMREAIRRMINRQLTAADPGGREVQDILLRLTKRGVPHEAFYQIDVREVMVVRAVGGGSAAAKTLAIEDLGQMYERMDDVGRANYNWDRAVNRAGVAGASRYFTKNGVVRTTVDTQIAINQNFILANGGEAPVLPSDKHLAHAREHVKPLMQAYELVEQGQAELAPTAVQYAPLYDHTVQHVEAASGDPATAGEVAALNQMLQRIGEVISNGLKEAENAAEEAQATEPGPSPETIAMVEKARLQLDIQRQNADAKREIMIEQARVKDAVADAAMAAKIERERLDAEARREREKLSATTRSKRGPAKKTANKKSK